LSGAGWKRTANWQTCLLLPLLWLVLCLGSASAQEPQYLSEIQDLPLMPGLTEVDGAGLVFDKPNGRIVESYARGDVEASAVRSFYRATLPQLGWRLAADGDFVREGESLMIESEDGQAGLTVRFVLRPR
jgi:hypothetical protein